MGGTFSGPARCHSGDSRASATGRNGHGPGHRVVTGPVPERGLSGPADAYRSQMATEPFWSHLLGSQCAWWL